MTKQLLGPDEAVSVVARRIAASWAERLLAEAAGLQQAPIVVPLRPGVTTGPKIETVGREAWTLWKNAWRTQTLTEHEGIHLETREIRDVGVTLPQPVRLHITDLAAAERMLEPATDLHRARTILARLQAGALGIDLTPALLTPALLKSVCKMSDLDVDILLDVLTWVGQHHDLSRWTARQIPVPRMHSKWWEKNVSLLSALTGRDLVAETRARPSVVHLTYADPDYLAAGERRHDSWTSNDAHALPYSPRVVVVVENRDSRVWFPDSADTVVVEGEGKAAASLLSDIPWIRAAERVIYWGDIDVDGFAILHDLRLALATHGVVLESMLMDEVTRVRYAEFGVNTDKHGVALTPSNRRLGKLTPDEAAAYANVATSGPAVFRRIEQERISPDDVLSALAAQLEWHGG